eukprot:341185-Heterocapsa_arctica.AAC.1
MASIPCTAGSSWQRINAARGGPAYHRGFWTSEAICESSSAISDVLLSMSGMGAGRSHSNGLASVFFGPSPKSNPSSRSSTSSPWTSMDVLSA